MTVSAPTSPILTYPPSMVDLQLSRSDNAPYEQIKALAPAPITWADEILPGKSVLLLNNLLPDFFIGRLTVTNSETQSVIVTAQPTESRHICNICFKSFATKDILLGHARYVQ
jgi:hypothetical protein